MEQLRLQSKKGWSIIEILIALAVFSVAISGLYIAMSSAQESLTTSMRRDMEAAMVNTLVAEINPYNRLIESAYDQTTKQQLSLPDGGSVWYTRIVSSEDDLTDRKDVNVYFYRNQSDTTPYRQFRREISPDFIGFNCSDGTEPDYIRDSNGNIYNALTHNTIYSNVAGSRSSGFGVFMDASGASAAVTGTSDADLFSHHCVKNSGTGMVFLLASSGQKYNVVYGTYAAAGDGSALVNVNGVITTVDPLTEVGANKALVKTFQTTAVDAGTYGLVTVGLTAIGGPVRLTHIGLEKAD